MLILKDEHAIDVLKSGNTGHLWHDFHAIGVHATDVGHPDDPDVTGDQLDEAPHVETSASPDVDLYELSFLQFNRVLQSPRL